MENSNLPKLTDEQRKAALARAAQARRERTEFKGLVKKGELSLTDAIADERANRIRVHELLTSVPGIGKAKADDIMRKLGIADNRRVQGLGCRQRDLIIEFVEKVK
ncbi:integration host factor, actinobacterial type [Ellagibacter isourolithinifaciens]|uniref:integration host factor, actinobacterial type n=1 Tax=Ellagibacter isourolithinifaciens TaxID=2137581 RepID=UPI003A923112